MFEHGILDRRRTTSGMNCVAKSLQIFSRSSFSNSFLPNCACLSAITEGSESCRSPAALVEQLLGYPDHSFR